MKMIYLKNTRYDTNQFYRENTYLKDKLHMRKKSNNNTGQLQTIFWGKTKSK